MKKTFLKIAALFAVVVATTTSVLAQGSFAYQAVIRDSNGELVKDKDVNAKFSLLEKGKTAAYVETQKVKTNQYGNISVMVGSGTKVSGDFNQVPWNTMSVMMKVEIDVEGGNNFKEIGEIQLQPVPYAFYAASAGSLTNNNAGGKDPIFSVKDDKGELVFAVYNDGVKVFVDDTDPSKAMSTGFAVSGRRAAKEGETNDYFVVNGNGTTVYVDEDSTKAMSTGFAVSGRRAAKDGSADLFTVNNKGTQVYIEDDADKAMSTGFAVSGRRAAKDGAAEDYLTINTTSGTQVYIDDDADKAMSTGFAVSGRRAAKDGVANDYLTIDVEGTKVYVDEEDPKAMSTGFAVSGRRAAKDGLSANLFTVNGGGTQVFIDEDSNKAMSTGFAVSGRRAAKGDVDTVDYFTINTTDGTMVFVDDDPSKAMSTGFAVAGRRAAKDGEPELLLKVNGDGTQVFIDESKAMSTGFAVSGRRAAKEDSVINYLSINDTSTQFISDEFLIKGKGENVDTLLSMSNSSTKFKGSSFSVSDGDVDLFAVENGNVHINSDMVMSGDVEKKADIKMLSDVVEIPITLSQATQYEIKTDGVFKDIEEFSLLKIVGESAVLVQADGLAFTADGGLAKNNQDVVIVISLSGNELSAAVNPAKISKDVTITFGIQNGYTEGAKFKVTFKK